MTYLDQAPGAQLIYDVRKHHISVFVFQERSLQANLGEKYFSPKKLPFNMETWSQDGLCYFVIGDASPNDIDSLARTCFKNSRGSGLYQGTTSRETLIKAGSLKGTAFRPSANA